MGEVFLARSKSGRLVAIKVLDEAQRGSDSAGTFAREASLCARLQHPTIVQVRAFIEDDECAALIFEYVAGVALGRLLRFCSSHGVRLPDSAAWHIVERVLSALAYAHSFKDDQLQPTPIVHRDVSPSNVLVDWNGGVKLTDFGIAKMIGVSPTTRIGLVKGTLGCMAPEQARGDEVTPRADVYAAALLAWRLATGRVPFAKHQRDEYELLRAMRNPRIKPLAVLRPDLPEPLLGVVARALEPEPHLRTISAAEFAQVIRTHMEVGQGAVDLGTLLDRWKHALERTVKREGTAEESSSQQRVANTLRYEEVALAFDEDDVPLDGPTFQAAALPSEAAILATLPLDDDGSLHALPTAVRHEPAAPHDTEPPRANVPAPTSSAPPPPPATAERPAFDSAPLSLPLAPAPLPSTDAPQRPAHDADPRPRSASAARRFAILGATAGAVVLVVLVVALLLRAQ